MSSIHSDRGIAESPLSNGDLAPTEASRRTWGTYDFAALWIGLSIVTTTYTLASGLISAGMTWWQGLLTVSLGNVIVLIPMLLNGHPGTKYGIPFPVLVRSSFGIRGANVAAMARALVACGWFGIQTWIGALAIDVLMATLWNGWADVGGHKAIAFGAFWLIELAIILRGIEGIRWLEQDRRAAAHRWQRRAADLGFDAGGGIGNVFSESSKLVTDDQSFWSLFAPGLAANIGYWITLSLNIPDFTRYARDQKSQVVGQSLAMPATMTAFSFVGIAVTAATIVVYGEAIWDPVALVARLLGDEPILLVLAMTSSSSRSSRRTCRGHGRRRTSARGRGCAPAGRGPRARAATRAPRSGGRRHSRGPRATRGGRASRAASCPRARATRRASP